MIGKIRYYIKRLYKIGTRQEIRTLPGHLAYSFILSIVPTITLIGYISSFLGLSMNTISNFIANSFSEETAKMFVPIITGKAFDLNVLSVLITGYFVASNGANAMILSSNRVYGIKDSSFLKRRIKAIFMTFFIVLLFLFIIIVPIFGNTILNFLHDLNPSLEIINRIRLIVSYVKWPISALIIFSLIKIIYTMAPDKEISSRHVNRGSLFTTIMWSIATFVYSYYAHNMANYTIFYGALTSVVVIMIWLYFLSYIFLIGMVLNKSSEETEEKIKLENKK